MCYKRGHLINWQKINSGCRPRWACGALWGRNLNRLVRTDYLSLATSLRVKTGFFYFSVFFNFYLGQQWARVIMLYVTSLVLIYIITASVYPWPPSHNSPCLPLRTTNLTSFCEHRLSFPSAVSRSPFFLQPCQHLFSPVLWIQPLQ